jgi:hypothetical protein
MKFSKRPLFQLPCCLWLFSFMMSWLVSSCSGQFSRKSYVSPEGYDIEKPVMIKLPLELDEISGVAFYIKDTSVFAINDEFGRLYKIFLNRPNVIHQWSFTRGADFEDLVLVDSNFYVLKSNGNIICFRFITTDSLYYSEYVFPFGTENEFEILYYDAVHRKLMLICKDCETDKKKFLSTFSFDPWTYKYETNDFHIDVTGIAKLAGEEKMKFKPSAASINPVDSNLYIISAINKLLVIADREGNAKEVFKISKGIFKQPEGVSFTPGGTMIISNEAADVGVANILVFPYRQTMSK